MKAAYFIVVGRTCPMDEYNPGIILWTLHSLCFFYHMLYVDFTHILQGILHLHWDNHPIAPVPVKQPWRIWVTMSHESHVYTTKIYVNCGYDNMAVILQTTFLNIFFCNCCISIQDKFHWNLFPRVQPTISHHLYDTGLAPSKPLSEPSMAMFNDATMCNLALMS